MAVRRDKRTSRLGLAWRPERPAALVGSVRRRLHDRRDRRVGAALIAFVSATAVLTASAQALTWSVVPSRNIKPATNDNELNAVSCVSAAACVAVGEQAGRHANGTPVTALIESWNGTSWSVVPSPRPGYRNALYGVSCTSAVRCTAVGANFVDTANATAPLVESWNGTNWSVVPSPGQVGMALVGVSCVSTGACAVVGDRVSSKGHFLTFTEFWNGTKWSIVPSPSIRPGADDNVLTGVSCVKPAACTAVGQYFFGLGHSGPLIESWNGTRWTIVPSPNRNDTGGLNGVSCASLTSCVAVGTYFSGPDVVNKTLTESWNGNRWSAGPTPKGPSQLVGASCVSATDCWAAGNSWAPAGNTRTFVEHWNGTRWATVATPNAGPASYYDNPVAVSCAPTGSCAVAGNYGNYGLNGISKTLTMIGTPGG